MTIFDEYIGIFEDKDGWVTRDDPYDDADGIDLDEFNGEGNDYWIVDGSKWQRQDDYAVKIKNNPLRNSIATGVGAAGVVLAITGYLVDDQDYIDLDYYNDFLEFATNHKAVTDSALYLVIGKKNYSGDWICVRFEDNNGTIHNYLKGKIANTKMTKQYYGMLDYAFQFQEAWLP